MTDPLPGSGGPWQRLHPLTPLVRGTRVAVPLLVLLILDTARRAQNAGVTWVIDVVLVSVIVVVGLVHWLVTRWAFDGATLRVETGLVRRDSRQLPVTRIQAVDIVQPALARPFGLAELKIQVAGAAKDTRLAYLRESDARSLRAALLAAHHGFDAATPEPAEAPIAVVPTGRLVGSVALSAPTLILVAVLVCLGVLVDVSTKVGVGVAAASFAYLIGLATAVIRRFNGQYRFTVAVAPDGIRVRRGLAGTVAETIPYRRVQAVRQIEPLWWRLFGWCRLEVDLAGVPKRERAAGTREVTKTLLPVGPVWAAAELRTAVLGSVTLDPDPPPRRARFKAPLSYHFLSATHDDSMVMATIGRIRKVTCWMPLHKAQSFRWVQGPVQRRLHLATLHVDVASRRVEAVFRDRDAAEARELVERLAALSRAARGRDPTDPLPPRPTVGPVPSGWYIDPSGRHAGRFWDGVRWTAHVDDHGAPALDPL